MHSWTQCRCWKRAGDALFDPVKMLEERRRCTVGPNADVGRSTLRTCKVLLHNGDNKDQRSERIRGLNISLSIISAEILLR